ncbi:MAG: DUF2062 domain-containing protein [Sneathiella sp.]|nr:DUF2062 domain-containing protein [Sneathiella sp.]
MFQRREKPSIVRRVRDFFWPSIGFKRSTKYVGYRLLRLPGTPYSLAAGFACGAAVSFTPFVGLHFIIAALIAWLIRANLVASAIGTVVGNPWTFPFIWAATFHVGEWMLGRSSEQDDITGEALGAFFHNFYHDGWASVEQVFVDLIFPMLVGCIPFFVVVWFLFFYPLRSVVHNFHLTRAEARMSGNGSRTVDDGADTDNRVSGD